MRRFEENQDKDFERALKIGRENAECIRQMERWCKHVEIRQTTEGLYAQISGLPYARHSISCPKIEGKMESMNLRWTFSDFLVENCSACPHHTPNGDTTWGQDIIRTRQEEARKHEQAAKEESDRIATLRSELRRKSQDISAEAGRDSLQILEFLETIFTEDIADSTKASQQLKVSATLGADLFPHAALDLILLLAGSEEFSEMLLPVCTALAQELAHKRSELASRFCQVALENIEKGRQPELSAALLNALGDGVEYPLSEVCIGQLLFSQNHSWLSGGSPFNKESDYANSTAVIVRSLDAEPESVLHIIRRELKNENDNVRFQLCGAIRLIQNARPQLVESLLGDLVRSLELYEDGRVGSEPPSEQITTILQSAFEHSGERVDQILAESMPLARPAVQSDIIHVYRGLLFPRNVSWEDRRENRSRTEVSRSEKVAIQRLLVWAKNDRFDLKIRIQALQALKTACIYATAEMLSYFDSLLGYFAILCGQERSPDLPPKILLPNQNQTQDLQVEELDKLIRDREWVNFKWQLQKCLEELCKIKPSETFDLIYDCLEQPSADLEDGFKAFCMTLLGVHGRNFALRGRVLPLLWRGLMDYESAWVRGKAIDAAVEMFSSSTSSPPANMVHIILVHLNDSKVVVHQAAWRAVTRRLDWFDRKQAHEALTLLGGYLIPYQREEFHLKEICLAILNIGWREQGLKLLALRMVELVFPTGEEYVDQEIADCMVQFCDPSEKIAGLVAKNIGVYLARHGRDRVNNFGDRERKLMFEWLHQLPTGTFQRVADDLLVSAKEVAKRDHWEACYFASLFSHFRAFRYEQSVLETAASALPVEPRNEKLRAFLQSFAKIAKGNESLRAGNGDLAEAYFEEGSVEV